MSEINELSGMFKALGDPTRLRMFQFLRTSCCEVAVGQDGCVAPAEGPTAGDVCCCITGDSKVTSTVSFHLKELRNAGLITMERRGKHMICGVNPEAVEQLAQFLGADPARVPTLPVK